MMSFDKQVLAVVQVVYGAALDESRWPQALKNLSEITGSQAATLWVLDGSDEPRLPTFTCINLDPTFIQEYLDRMAPLDPWNQYLVSHPEPAIVHDGLVISEREKDRHPYFDWHRRYSDTWFRLIGRVSLAPKVHFGVALHRTRRAGRFETRDIERFSVLYGHLERALMMGIRMGSLGAIQQGTADLLDRSPTAMLLLDEHKRVVFANRSAEALGARGDGLRLCEGRLTLLRKQDNDRLEGLIQRALSPVAPDGDSAGGISAQNPNVKLERCDQSLGTLAVVEDQASPWYYRLTHEYKLPSTVPLIRLLVQQSNCFVVVERGRAFGQMQTERALQQSGELRQGSNFGQGQVVAADYSLNPMITFSQRDTRGLGGALGFIPYAGAFGALAGGLRTSEASTTLTLVDNRSGVQLASAEGAASNMDFSLFGAGFGPSAAAGLGGYTNTPEGKVLAGAFADAYNRLVVAVRNYKAQEVKGGLGTGGALGVQGGTTAASQALESAPATTPAPKPASKPAAKPAPKPATQAAPKGAN